MHLILENLHGSNVPLFLRLQLEFQVDVKIICKLKGHGFKNEANEIARDEIVFPAKASTECFTGI